MRAIANAVSRAKNVGAYIMPTVSFAPHLQRHVPCPTQRVAASTLGEALKAAFVAAPALERYVLDEQGHVRKHVAVFVNHQMITSRRDLGLAVADEDSIVVIQALSGG
jgi:sulfur-carrier protein